MAFSSHLADRDILTILNLSASFLSIVGCLWMIWYCSRSIVYKTSALKLVLAIAVSDFFYSASNVMSVFETEDTHVLCQVEGFLRQFFSTASICFAASTGILCYQDSKLDPDFNQAHFFRKTFLVTILICLALGLMPLFLSFAEYEPHLSVCAVVYDITETTGQIGPASGVRLLVLMIFRGIPLLIGLAISVIGYTKAIQNTKKALDGLVDWKRVAIYRLLWYPIVLFLIFVPSVSDNIVHIYQGTSFWSEAIHIAITHSVGFANALVYGLQRKAWCQTKREHEEELDKSKCLNFSSQLINFSLPEDLLKASIATTAL